MLRLLALVLWVIVGAINLSSSKIDKLSYGIVWFCLLVNLFMDYVKYMQ